MNYPRIAPDIALDEKSDTPKVSDATSIAAADPNIDAREVKVKEVLKACDSKDLGALVRHATSKYGFVKDNVRRVAWQLLLGDRNSASRKKRESWSSLPPHKDEDQVQLDVDRSFVYYPNDENTAQIERRKHDLSYVIVDVLRKHPDLCYFQGYHDIVQVILLVFDDRNIAAYVASRMSLLRIRDFMLPSMTASISHLRLLPPILYTADRELYNHVQGAQPYFALAATLTMYAHDIQEYGDIARLFDFLISQEAVMSIYLYAAIILSRRAELLEVPQDDPQMQHFILSKLPQPLDLDALIARAVELYKAYPPTSLPFRAWANVSPYSVLKTTTEPQKIWSQTDEACMRNFTQHAAQVARQDARQKALSKAKYMAWAYRKPASAVGLAIVVGVFALWLGRNGNSNMFTRSPLFGTLAYKVLGVR
ncbi:GTPase-activating protein gyp10 [Pseudovirgaria hyperparasitica]|uniref:GTPase-activating protein gyp10 n=1 Tax=Pseudovirgaria hyperparasitica TaxID=470096 RepID=A0A6A6VSX6_9PEZI|nr:GTPase-activating protein gyp10 [Pseudovirgaria hyperparasitica]KAF2752886.1 GTPase-activating protein gyp10 [Pseudovirgaria hyperparasitica]